MWSIFHTVTFFERALKRSGVKKAHVNLENSSTSDSTPLNPMASHISWMLNPLLKVCVLIRRGWPCVSSSILFHFKMVIMLLTLFFKYFVLFLNQPSKKHKLFGGHVNFLYV